MSRGLQIIHFTPHNKSNDKFATPNMESSHPIIDETAEKKVFSLYQLNKSIKNTLESKTGNATILGSC